MRAGRRSRVEIDTGTVEEPSGALAQRVVLGLRVLVERDVGVCALPELEKCLIRGQRCGVVTHCALCSRQMEPGQWTEHPAANQAGVSQDPLKLGRRGSELVRSGSMPSLERTKNTGPEKCCWCKTSRTSLPAPGRRRRPRDRSGATSRWRQSTAVRTSGRSCRKGIPVVARPRLVWPLRCVLFGPPAGPA